MGRFSISPGRHAYQVRSHGFRSRPSRFRRRFLRTARPVSYARKSSAYKPLARFVAVFQCSDRCKIRAVFAEGGQLGIGHRDARKGAAGRD